MGSKRKKKQGVKTEMKKVREILRLFLDKKMSRKKISLCTDTARSTVGKYVLMAETAKINNEIVEQMNDSELAIMLGIKDKGQVRTRPGIDVDFAAIHKELASKKGITLELLWKEKRAADPEFLYSYSWFCGAYKIWKRPLNATLRKNYKAGEFLFVDFSGKTVPYYDKETEEEKQAEIFVATLGCSNFTFCEARKSQSLEDWIQAHVNTFEYFGVVPEAVVPDNLRSGVTRACKYDADVNTCYWALSKHYDTLILPARARSPKDKAKVEAAVGLVQRWILAKLRHFKFFSIDEINEKIAGLLEGLNNKNFQKLDGTRRSWFEELEKPVMTALPSKRYEITYFKKATVYPDYHVELEKVFYSVPWRLVGQKVIIRYTWSTVEILQHNERITSHRREYKKGYASTLSEHKPPNHSCLDWSPERLRRWAANIGGAAYKIVDGVLKRHKNEDHGIRKVLGILSLNTQYGEEAFNEACLAVREPGFTRVKQLKEILKNNGAVKKTTKFKKGTSKHKNVRGAEYYASGTTTSKEKVN